MLRELFEAIKEGAGQTWDQMARPGIQGAAELASALYAGHSFVPYGAGQQPAELSEEQAKEQGIQEVQPELERGMGR